MILRYNKVAGGYVVLQGYIEVCQTHGSFNIEGGCAMMNTNVLKIALACMYFLLLAFTSFSPCQINSEQSGEDQPDIDVKEIMSEIWQIADEAKALEAETVYNIIRQNIRVLDELVIEVNSSTDINSLMDKIIDSLEEMTISYEEISNMRPSLEVELAKKSSRLRQLTTESRKTITDLGKKVSELEADKRDIYKLPKSRQEIRRKALEQKILLVRKRIELLERFAETQIEINGNLDVLNLAVSDLLYVIGENAQIYREALKLAKLRRDLRDALVLGEEILQIQTLTTDIISSWQKLDDLIDAILKDILGSKGIS